MPELPEVEIVKKSLKKNTKGKKILNVIVKNRNLRFYVENGFEKIVKNKKIKDIVRYAKYLIIKLENKVCIIIHLGMTGTFHILKNNKFKNTNLSFYHSKNLPTKHNHIEFIFKYFRIIYNDPRRFGYFKIFRNTKKLKSFINNYGLEPFNKEFNFNYVKEKLKDKKKKHKRLPFRSEIYFWNWKYLCK